MLASVGTPIATLSVFDSNARPEGLTYLQRLTLCVLAKQGEGQLALRGAMIECDARGKQRLCGAT